MNEAAPQLAAAHAAPARRRSAPGSRAYIWLLPGAALALFAPGALRLSVLSVYNALLVVLFLWDRARLHKAALKVARTLEPRLRALVETRLALRVDNGSALSLKLTLEDSTPESFVVEPARHSLKLGPGKASELSYRVVPTRRGRTRFGDVFVGMETRLGLAAVVVRIAQGQEVRVVPAASLEQHGAVIGPRRDVGSVAHRLRKASQGTDLESLREYVAEDPLRAIDWKATAKRLHPITRLYQPERSQTLWLVLDASRTMAAAIGDNAGQREGRELLEAHDVHKTRFDVALEAALVLADGALRAGDQVGALVFADQLKLLVPPGRGRAHYRRLLDALSEAHPGAVQLDVRGLVSALEQSARKRSLLVLFTDLENESHGAALCDHARILTRRHLTLCVSLDDSLMGQLMTQSPDSDAQAFQKAAAIDLLEERTELRAKLEKKSVLVLEADERGLARTTLDRYLEIKTQARL